MPGWKPICRPWAGLVDPTNNILAGERHIRAAVGAICRRTADARYLQRRRRQRAFHRGIAGTNPGAGPP
jgi:hypothetical protein